MSGRNGWGWGVKLEFGAYAWLWGVCWRCWDEGSKQSCIRTPFF